jgi:hypothetical protein
MGFGLPEYGLTRRTVLTNWLTERTRYSGGPLLRRTEPF